MTDFNSFDLLSQGPAVNGDMISTSRRIYTKRWEYAQGTVVVLSSEIEVKGVQQTNLNASGLGTAGRRPIPENRFTWHEE